MLHTFARGSYCECTFEETADKLENISRNNKECSTGKVNTIRNTFAVQPAPIKENDDIYYKMTQMST